MSLKLRMFIFIMSFFLMLQVQAQDRLVSGKVTAAEDGTALSGATVLLKGTTVGAFTDDQGRYQVRVPSTGGTLIFTFYGYDSQEIEIANQTTLDVQMVEEVNSLEEVVITALGVQRDKKALGYAVQELHGQELVDTKESNIVNSLSGKIAGVQVTSSSGAPGASSRIVIRGASSLLGNNQPLFVVDGIPLDNTQFSSSPRNSTNEPAIGTRKGDEEQGVADYGNAISDLNPDDIESISVLKGPTAVALYGSRAQNGAFIITTKSGKAQKGIGVTLSSSYSLQTPLRLPEFQNEYGQGGYGLVDYPDYIDVDESWGHPLDGRIMKNVFAEDVPWVANPDNVKNFFETGYNFVNNASLQGGNDLAQFRFSLSNLDQKGIVPNTGIGRTNVGLKAGLKASEKLSITTSINYAQTSGKNRPLTGYDGQNVFQSMFNWHGRQIDYARFKDYKNEDGSFVLNLADPNYSEAYGWPIAPIPAWQNNPYANLYENVNTDRRDRVIGNFKINYDLTPWLSAYLRAGTDFYSDRREQIYKAGLKDPSSRRTGGFVHDNYNVNTYNIDFVISAKTDFTSNFSGSLLVGANRFHNAVANEFTYVEGLLIPDVYNISNARGTPDAREFRTAKRINGIYAAGQLSYKNYLFLDLTGRNDWSSTLPAGSRSYFYPSASGSFVFSDALSLPSFFSFGKVRAGIAQVGNDTDPFVLQSYFVKKRIADNNADITFPFNGQPSFALGDELANADLLPESTTSWEVGTDLRFFDNRLGVDVTYYTSSTQNQLMKLTLPSSSGFSSQVINAGEIRNNGIEVMLLATPVSTAGGFEWNLGVNFAKNNSNVVALHPQVESIILETHRAQLEARPGQPYGIIYGTAWNRVTDESSPYFGERIIEADGRPTRAAGGNQVLGNVQPDFLMGINNSISYKGAYLSFLVDWKQGGDMFSLTNFFGGYSGVLSYTTEGRDGTYIAEGVAANPDGSYRPNDIPVDAEEYWHRTFSAQESGVYDATYIKLREVKLGYAFPSSLMSKTPFAGLTIALQGRNLWIIHSLVPNVDPESSAYGSSNGQGFEVNGIPSVRSFGGTITLKL
ncbi:MAG: SusC/RagA family TonB-linked outer membrane protein [Bacteroidia bacterium]